MTLSNSRGGTLTVGRYINSGSGPGTSLGPVVLTARLPEGRRSGPRRSSLRPVTLTVRDYKWS